MGNGGWVAFGWHSKRRIQPFKRPCESSGSSGSGSKKKLIKGVSDDAMDALSNALGSAERNSLFAGIRASGNWAGGEKATEVEAFVQANAAVGDMNLFAEAAAALDGWQATAGLKWSW